MEIMQEDVSLAKDQFIADLINENLKLRSMLNAKRRAPEVEQAVKNHPANGGPFPANGKPTLSVAPPSSGE
jgi:hypothetical protein